MRSRMPVTLSSFSPTLRRLANVTFSDTQLFFYTLQPDVPTLPVIIPMPGSYHKAKPFAIELLPNRRIKVVANL